MRNAKINLEINEAYTSNVPAATSVSIFSDMFP